MPDPIGDQIASWNLPFEVEEQLYTRLHDDLAVGHEATCWRVPAPSPTYVYCLDLEDSPFPVVSHHFTFWLTYGPEDYCLYVYQCDHKEDAPEN